VAQTLELNTDGIPPSHAADPLIGQELLHYRVVEIIGQGGMSVVYRGHDEHLHRDVAIKVLHPFLAEKPECRLRLAREARAVARLEHPHILKVFDFSGDPPTLDERPDAVRTRTKGFGEGFIITELVRGATLKKFVEQHALWRCPEIGAMVVWQMAMALQHAHEHGVVHRDIKPENIMVRVDGWLKLMDFGIAHIADQGGLTVTGTLLGSPAHMAPECIDGHAADARSDLFSLGTVLYWITTGTMPFEALTPHALLKQIVEGRTVPAQQRSPRVSDELGRIIAKAMATRPNERYATANDFATALEELLEKCTLPAEPERLRAALADAKLELPAASALVRTAQLRRAEQLLADAQPARALSCLSRVLADDKDDVDARALLERAQDVIALEPVPVAESPTRAPPARWSGTMRQLGVVAAAGLLIASAVLIATALDDRQPPPVLTDDGISTGEPAGLDKAPPLPEKLAPVIVPPVVKETKPEKRIVKAPRVAPAVATRQVTLWARPWADIYVDGKKVASGKKAEVAMAVGPHVVTFKATGATDVVQTLDVTSSGPLPDVKADLETKLAYLVVEETNVPDAFVEVSGQGRARGKSAKETVDRAIPVRLAASQQMLEVTIYKKGYVLLVRKVPFVAGETVRLKRVMLEREAHEGAPAP
jgi:serine/threonine-protein kinase